MNTTHIKGIIIRNMYLWYRDYDRLVDAFWWAFFDIAIWGVMSSYYTKAIDSTASGHILAGIILWTVLARSQWEISSTMIVESWDKNLINVFTAPVKLSEFMTASVLLGLAKALLVLSFTAVITSLMLKFNIFQLSWWIVPLLGNIFLTGVWIAFIVNSLILRLGKNAITLAWSLIFLINPISGIMYPLSALPTVFQQIARLLPSSYVFESMRQLLSTGQTDISLIIISFFLNMVYLSIAIFIYSRTFETARERGWLTKLM